MGARSGAPTSPPGLGRPVLKKLQYVVPRMGGPMLTRHAGTLMIALGAGLAAGGTAPQGQGQGQGTPLANRAGLKEPQQAVLVTGASTGIGRKITEVLAAKGYFVYAGARREQDLKELGAIPNVQAIKLDVTVKEDIAAAVATVEKA